MIVTVIYSDGEEIILESEKKIVSVGRGASCDIVIPDDQISRKHLSIKEEEGILYIKDLTLSNWVSYNEDKLSKSDYIQYFDFARLMLPGNIRLVLKTEESIVDENSLEQNKEINSDDLYSRTKIANKTQEIKRGKENKKRQTRKELDPETLKFIFLSIIVVSFGAYATFYLYDMKVEKSFSKLAKSSYTPRKKIKRPVSATPKKIVESDTSTSYKIGEVAAFGEKCSLAIERSFCNEFKVSESKGEGVFVRKQELYLMLDFVNTGRKLYKSEPRFNDLKQSHNQISVVLASYLVLHPKMINKLKDSYIKKVHVYLLNGNDLHIMMDIESIKFIEFSTYDSAIKEVVNNNTFEIYRTKLKDYIKIIR